jgi:hypothetical protein
MTINFPEWFGAFKRIADPAARKLQEIVARDTAFQQQCETTTSVLSPEAAEAAKVVQTTLDREIREFHEARRPALVKRHMELIASAEQLAAQTADALGTLDSFEHQANGFIRQTRGRALRPLASADLRLALDGFRQNAARARESAHAESRPIRSAIRRVLQRPTFADLLGKV